MFLKHLITKRFASLDALQTLTGESRRTQAGESPHFVHTGASVHAGLRHALVHVNLTASALETRHAEARKAVAADPTQCPVLAGVWGAVVHSWRQLLRRCT